MAGSRSWLASLCLFPSLPVFRGKVPLAKVEMGYHPVKFVPVLDFQGELNLSLTIFRSLRQICCVLLHYELQVRFQDADVDFERSKLSSSLI